jgi:hypothetical protein
MRGSGPKCQTNVRPSPPDPAASCLVSGPLRESLLPRSRSRGVGRAPSLGVSEELRFAPSPRIARPPQPRPLRYPRRWLAELSASLPGVASRGWMTPRSREAVRRDCSWGPLTLWSI